jgi:hypothetical protein
MSVDRAYAELLKGKQGVKVIVVYSWLSVDIEHEDLKSVVWTTKEIPGNGIDDDNNGTLMIFMGGIFLEILLREFGMNHQKIKT